MFQFLLGKDAASTLKKHLTTIAKAIGATMGPGGRPFGYDKLNPEMRMISTFSKDGLTVLRALRFEEPSGQALLQYCQQAAAHSVIASGDGSSSTIVLADAVAQAVLDSDSKYPQAFARELEADALRAIDAIKKEAITGDDIMRMVSLTSSNGDQELTDVVINAVKSSSAFGSILTIKNPAAKTRYRIDRQDGYSYCKGYDYNNVFATSASPNAASSKPIEWNNPYVVVFNMDLVAYELVSPALKAWEEACAENPAPLIIIGYEVGDALANQIMVGNRRLNDPNKAVFIVKPRLTAEVNAGVQIIRDISSFCGIEEKYIVDGGNYKKVSKDFFGTCKYARIGVSNTIFAGRAKNHWVADRISQNASIAAEARSDFDRQITMIRNAELAEGLVKVEIGGGLMPDLQEREDRFDDASKAAQACMRNGALPGCGLSYIRAAEVAGVHPALSKAFRSIYTMVLNNYGVDVDPTVFPCKGEGLKIDEKLGLVRGNAFELGVLDAAETVYSVIQNGVALGVKVATIGGFLFREQKIVDNG